MLDSLAPPSNYWQWRIDGAAGEQASGYSWQGDAMPALWLSAGVHTLTVQSYYAIAIGAVPLRLLSFPDAATVLPGQAAAGTLDQSRGSRVYRVPVEAGHKVRVQTNGSAGGSVGWRLFDLAGRLAASGGSFGASSPVLDVPSSGDYWLVVDGDLGNSPTAQVSFDLTVQAFDDLAVPLALPAGDSGEVSGQLAVAGQSVVYDFDVAQAGTFVFDSLTNRGDLQWTLSDGVAAVFTGVALSAADAATASPARWLAAGHYQLRVFSSASATGAFQFRVRSSATATVLVPGTAVSGTLQPGTTTQAYRFAATAGDQLALSGQSVSGGTAQWRLIDPFGRDVLGSRGMDAALAATTLGATGDYLVLVEGAVANTQPVQFAGTFALPSHVAVPGLPAGDPLTLGDQVAEMLGWPTEA